MYRTNIEISVWFACKSCLGYFRTVEDFVVHKKEVHFNEFLRNTSSCIVFEERSDSNNTNGFSLQPILVNGVLSLQLTSKSPLDHQNQIIDGSSTDAGHSVPIVDVSAAIGEATVEPTHNIVEPSTSRAAIISGKSRRKRQGKKKKAEKPPSILPKQPEQKQNPFVLLKRLTAKEIEEASFRNNTTRTQNNLKSKQNNLIKINKKYPAKSVQPTKAHPAHFTSFKFQPKKSKNNTLASSIASKYSKPNLLPGPLKSLECQLCSTMFNVEADLRIHIGVCSTSHKDRDRYCVLCNKKLSNLTSLKHHNVRYHGTEKEKQEFYKFKCQFCPKKFPCERNLYYHVESHKNVRDRIKPYKCQVCEKSFIRQDSLTRHRRETHLWARTKPGKRKFEGKRTTTSYDERKSSLFPPSFLIQEGEFPTANESTPAQGNGNFLSSFSEDPVQSLAEGFVPIKNEGGSDEDDESPPIFDSILGLPSDSDLHHEPSNPELYENNTDIAFNLNAHTSFESNFGVENNGCVPIKNEVITFSEVL